MQVFLHIFLHIFKPDLNYFYTNLIINVLNYVNVFINFTTI